MQQLIIETLLKMHKTIMVLLIVSIASQDLDLFSYKTELSNVKKLINVKWILLTTNGSITVVNVNMDMVGRLYMTIIMYLK